MNVLWDLVLSFHLVGPGDPTQLSELSPFTDPSCGLSIVDCYGILH